MSVFVVLWVLFAHWEADFCLQTRWQASNKSKNWNALTRHVLVYTITAEVLVAPLFGRLLDDGIFVGVTFMAHFITDAITSRITARLYAKGDLHNFFVVIGFDQFLHYVQLFATLWWLGVLTPF